MVKRLRNLIVLAILAVPAFVVAAKYGRHIEGEAPDPYASAPASVAIWQFDDSGTKKWVVTDDTGEYIISDFATTDDHGNLVGLIDDDHDTGVNAYHTAARHLSDHDSAFNNALTVTGFIDSDATLGAHGANADIHWFRPAQTHTVAKNGTGEYATIATAVTAANAAASSVAPQEVVIFGGVYDENSMVLSSYVSVRSAVPQQAIIDSNSASPIFSLNGTQHHLTDLQILAGGAGGVLKVTGAVGGIITLDNCRLRSDGTGPTIDFNADDCSMTIHGQCSLFSSAGPIITGKTAASQMVVHNSSLSFTGTAAPNPAVVNIDANFSSTPDLFSDCVFNATSLTGGTTPSAFIDWDANDLHLRNCLFRLKSAAATDFRAIYCQSGNVFSQSNQITWTAIAGTAYDYYVDGGATISTVATVYDIDQVGGAGSIVALAQGDMAGNDLYLTGQLTMDGDDTPLMQLLPSGTGSQTVVNITPQNAIGGSAAWIARNINGANLDPSGAAAAIRGDFVDFSGVSQANNPLIIGWQMDLPANYTSSSEVAAAKYAGDGRTLQLCTDDEAVHASAPTENGGLFEFIGAETNTAKDALRIEQTTSGNMANNYGVGISAAIKDSADVDNLIGRMLFKRNGADDVGTFEVWTGAGASVNAFTIDGSANSIFLDEAISPASAFFIVGQATGAAMYDDGTGFVIDASRGDPLLIGDTVALQLGDEDGAESLLLLDSGDATRLSVDSDGNMDVFGEIMYIQTYEMSVPVPLTSAGVGPSKNPDFSLFLNNGAGSTGVYQWAFSPVAEEELNFSITIQHGYDEGTDIMPVIHWSPSGTGGAGEFVQWGLEYAWANVDALFSTTTIITTDASAAGTATTSGDGTMLDFKNYSSEFPSIDGTGMERHSVFIGRIFRDAGAGDDDYPNDAFGMVLDLHITIDQPGIPN